MGTIKNTQVIESPVTTFDEEHELYETKVGESDGGDLHFSVWGKIESASRAKAEMICKMINLESVKKLLKSF